ncbi:MAG: UDP-N-acetylmuramoyl-tripeptide--D-alanyl-D-alanine ligase [Gemmatimonadetes bacterium]|nr:UDP-N-acetylmuramoyl-tripeptide--D-alanyl-D-alanine ligase [Gemmatimonadota bacterium]MYG22370.1 UDP-N-acetylmuramoyl-tripeptide--D-alanyl-D-alanine ligase [Gemmatimonadota bacterium]MYJ38037.1 UDP-N-acetylmuramoyl-tripeptide--D-alanyl-D-alanine ligase [Gemmatimonadota bacterium]
MSGFHWTDAEVRHALGLAGGDSTVRYRGVSTDTRTLRPGDIFVAIAGDRFDGHDFIPRAVRAGCAAVVASRAPGDLPVAVYRVPDTLKALGDLALHRRKQLDVPVVGITGSSGKTTVKDLTLGALGAALRPHGTTANENNRVGTPLTILSTPETAGALVLELGTNEPGEIAELARIARPTIGVVTTVSETHVERLGDFQGVLSEKLDLLRGMHPGGRAVVGDEPPDLAVASRGIHPGVAVAGRSRRADHELRPRDARLRDGGTYDFTWMGQPISLRIPGAHNLYNALLALTVAHLLEVDPADAAAGVSAVGPGPMRGEVRRLRGLTLLVDCYNANAAGVEAAVRTLEEMAAPGRRVAVLGTMLELGERSAAIHCDTLARVLRAGIDRYVLTGAFAHAARCYPDDRIDLVEGVDELAERLPGLARPGDTLLLKASRGVRLERAIPALESSYGGRAD